MPIDAGNARFLLAPIMVLAMIALLGLFLRWAFGTGAPARIEPEDHGLLTRVATLSRRETALALRALLSDAGIRSTIRFPGAHRAVVLVFPEDADRARSLAASFADGSA